MALRTRTPWARALLPATRSRASGQLGALLSSPVLDVRLMTALQVLQTEAPLTEGAGPSLPGLQCRAVVVPSSRRTRNHHAATVAGARHVPVGRTVLVESVCRQGGTHSGAVPTGRGSKGVAPQRGRHSSQRPHLRKVGHGSPRNFLANTRARHRRAWGGRAAAARLTSS